MGLELNNKWTVSAVLFHSKKLAANVASLFPEGYEAVFVEIGNLALYNQDFDDENNVPSEYTTFRNKMKEIDAVLFVTPEYNRTIPAVIKNALDVGSRPYGASVWNGKPAAIISQSPGKLGGFGANQCFRKGYYVSHSTSINLVSH